MLKELEVADDDIRSMSDSCEEDVSDAQQARCNILTTSSDASVSGRVRPPIRCGSRFDAACLMEALSPASARNTNLECPPPKPQWPQCGSSFPPRLQTALGLSLPVMRVRGCQRVSKPR